MSKYTLHAGRTIYRDGIPFLALNYVAPKDDQWNPGHADRAAHGIISMITANEERILNREELSDKAVELAESWQNGNRRDVVKEMLLLTAAETACIVAEWCFEEMMSAGDMTTFCRMIHREERDTRVGLLP